MAERDPHDLVRLVTAPNPPIGSEATNWKETNGWFALGFSVTWDGPPARVVPAQPVR